MTVELDTTICDGHLLKWLVAAGLAWLEHNMERVNHMNVFPVPDGDTGINMYHTMQRAYQEIAGWHEAHAGKVAQGVAKGALMGARGNSGTILSQLLRGFADGLQDEEMITSPVLAKACEEAIKRAYASVKEPVEGTILTVARDASEAVSKIAQEEVDLSIVFDAKVKAARESVQHTPNLLPVLKDAGVVDSGGLGLLYIIEGMQRLLNGEPVSFPSHKQTAEDLSTANWQDALNPDEEGYGYDVQFLMRGENLDVDKVRDEIDAMGWSTLVVGDPELVKVHVHVHNPGEPLNYAIGLGAWLDDIVVENMQAQYQGYVQDRQARESDSSEVDGVALIAVANGEGISNLFREYGVARLIHGGQSMNPSTEDFLSKIDSLDNRDIILLPNNKNILLTAEQAVKLSSEKDVRVLPTRTMPQGISSLLPYLDANENGATIDSVYSAMQEAYTEIVTCEITTATRDVDINGVLVKEGAMIGLVDGKLVVAEDRLPDAVMKTLQKAHIEDFSLVTLYRGLEVDADEHNRLVEQLRVRWDGVEFEVIDGGQPLYPYLMSLE